MGRMWQKLAEAFASSGHAVTIVARSFNGQPEEELSSGVRYIRCGGFSQSGYMVCDVIRDLIYSLRTLLTIPSGDILVINDLCLPIVAAWRPNLGRIVVSANRMPKGQYRFYRGISLIAAASGSVSSAVSRQCPHLAPVVKTIPNPTDVNIFRPAELEFDASSGIKILYVGRIHREKGLGLLIEAVSRGISCSSEY